MRIGIMGGTFNPIHIAHLIVAQSAAEEYHLDKILFIVSANPPHKYSQKITDANIRYEMVSLAIADNPLFEPSKIEIERIGKSFTYTTICDLEKIYPANTEFYLIIGMDEASNFHAWYKYKELSKKCNLVIANRPHHKAVSIPENASLFNIPNIEISSTDIRSRVYNNKSIKYMVNDKVLKLIKEKGLYS